MAVFEAQVAKVVCRNSLPIKERLDFDTTWDSTVRFAAYIFHWENTNI